MNPQYEILAKCLLPAHMLEWFELTNVEVKPKEKKSAQDQQSEEYSPNVIHLYLDENDLTPDNRDDLRPNGFTPAKTFHDFPIRGQEVLLHVRRRRWLDADNHNITLGHSVELMASYQFSKDITLLAGYTQMYGTETMSRLKQDGSGKKARWGWFTLTVSPSLFTAKW